MSMSTAVAAKEARMELEDVWFCYQTLLDLSHLPPPPLPQQPPSSRTKRADKDSNQGSAQGEENQSQEEREKKEAAAWKSAPQSRTKEEIKARRKMSAATPTATKKEKPTLGSKTNRTATAPNTPSASASAKARSSDNAMELFKMKIKTILSNMAALTESVAHVQTQNETLEGMIKDEMEKERKQKKEIEQLQQEGDQNIMVASSGDFSLSVSMRDLEDAYKRQVEKVRFMDKKNDQLRNEVEALEEEIKQLEKMASIKQKSRRTPASTPASSPQASAHAKKEREKGLTTTTTTTTKTTTTPAPRAPSTDTNKSSGSALGPQSSFAAWMAWVAARKEVIKTPEWKMKIVSLLEAIDVRQEVAGKEGDTQPEGMDEIGQEAISCAASAKTFMKEQKHLILEVEKAVARQRGRMKAIRHVSDRE